MATKKDHTKVDLLGKLPPQATDLEEAILGSLMIDNESINRIYLKPEYFYKDAHQKIFSAILDLKKKNSPIDLLTVTEQLRVNGHLDEAGGPFFVTMLTSKIASSLNIEFHAKIVTQKFIQRDLIRISTEIQTMAFDETNDVEDIFSFYNSEVERLSGNAIQVDDVKTWNDLVKETLNLAQERQKKAKEGKAIGIPTPIQKLTKWTCGWQPQQLIIIAGRPGMGKTAWALGCLRTAAANGYKPALFSLEMSDVSLANRIIIGESGVDADSFRRGVIESWEWEQIDRTVSKMTDWEILIDDKPKSINRIISKCKMLHKKGKIDMVVIDYIGLANDDTMKNNSNREQEIASISRKLKLLAKELNIPVIALSQLNRAVESRAGAKIPTLADLRESGAIEQDADMVLFVYRPEKYGFQDGPDGEPLNGRSFIILEKQREGETGMIPFRYNKSITAIYDYEEGYTPPVNYVAPNERHERSFSEAESLFENQKDDNPF